MIKYDVFRFFGTYRRIHANSSIYRRAEYYDNYSKQWKQSHVRAVELILGAHHVLVAHNVVFKDKAC